jgi:threonine aldolase
MIAAALEKKSFVQYLLPVETNIIIAECKPGFNVPLFISEMKEKGILFFSISSTRFRMVTHLDITPNMVQHLIETINKIN